MNELFSPRRELFRSKALKERAIERWQQALRVMNKMTPHERTEHFNMGSWGFQTECGTVACLAGHCSLDPWFRRRGFYSSWAKAAPSLGTPPAIEASLLFDRADPDRFFRDPLYGASIFYQTYRTFDQVRSAVRAHIHKLQKLKVER